VNHEYLTTEIAVDHDSLAPEENLLAQGIIDSIAIVQLVEFLEEKFDINVSEDEVVPENFESIAALAAFVQGKQAA